MIAEIARHGRGAWITKQLTGSFGPDPIVAGLLANTPMAAASPMAVRAAFPLVTNTYPEAIRQLQSATLVRQLYSSHQLLERMVELWWDRLHVSTQNGYGDLLPQRDALIRSLALGNFSDLLPATTRDPAMLKFLSADGSRGASPNENLGRELLELHTVGSGNYTETDVHNSALVLTGLTIAPDGTPTYNPKYHYVGPVQVMGWTHSNTKTDDGNAVIASYLDYLSRHPATAVHVSTMIARRFVADTPDPGLISAMAGTFGASGTSIVATLKTMIYHEAFAASVGAKAHGAYSGILASVRAMEASPAPTVQHPDPLQPLLTTLTAVGSAPMAWPVIDGPPDSTIGVSAATMLARWNVNQLLANQAQPGLSTPSVGLLGAITTKTPSGAVVDRAAGAVLHQQLKPGDRAVFLKFLSRTENEPIKNLAVVPGLIAMLLDSPYGASR